MITKHEIDFLGRKCAVYRHDPFCCRDSNRFPSALTAAGHSAVSGGRPEALVPARPGSGQKKMSGLYANVLLGARCSNGVFHCGVAGLERRRRDYKACPACSLLRKTRQGLPGYRLCRLSNMPCSQTPGKQYNEGSFTLYCVDFCHYKSIVLPVYRFRGSITSACAYGLLACSLCA